jgi:hypothetical protein
MEIGQKILDTIYKHNKSAYGASSECIEVVYDDDYDNLTDDLVKLFSLHIVSYQREQLLAFVKQLQEDNELTEEITFQDVNKFLANNCS